jgi:AcrR family transcriptional regulator
MQPARPRGRPRASDGEATRGSLLDAAAQVIVQRGYREASVNEVIARSGLSKGTFYWHFKSKDDLFFALLEERIDRPVLELVELLATMPPEQDMAPEANRRIFELLDREHDTVLLEHEYRSLAIRDPELRKRYVKRQQALREALARGLQARSKALGAPPFSTPVTEIASAFLALAHGLALERLIDREAVPEHILGNTFALVYQGLLARAEREG